MFGRHKLTHDGVATVVSCSDQDHNVMVSSGGHSRYKYDLVLDVYPQGAAPFRAAADHWFAIFMSPSPGDQLKVRCNPETQKVDIDVSDDSRFNPELHDAAEQAAREARKRADLAAPPGTPPAASRPFSGGDPDDRLDPELRELMRLEDEERRGGNPSG
jgi:hypothetical protein